MNIMVCEKFLQITILLDNPFLPKALNYAKKHFSKSYRLSSSVLILDDGQRFKKDYLINWAYCLDDTNKDEDVSYFLDFTYLPIRIKIIANNPLLVRVNLSLRILNLKCAIIKLDRDNHTIKRYLAKIFKNEWLKSEKDCIYLDASSQYFWEKIATLTSFKIIYNVILDFDMPSFKLRGGLGEWHSFLTQEEREIQNAYMILEVSQNDSFDIIKKSYLSLVKEYHPDNVYGDEYLVKAYQEKFIKIQNAYEIIKKLKQHIAV